MDQTLMRDCSTAASSTHKTFKADCERSYIYDSCNWVIQNAAICLKRIDYCIVVTSRELLAENLDWMMLYRCQGDVCSSFRDGKLTTRANHLDSYYRRDGTRSFAVLYSDEIIDFD